MNPVVDTKALGDMLRRRRQSLSLSLAGVGHETGISPSTLSRIENGIGVPDANNVSALLNWLDIPFDRVLDNKGEGAPVTYFPTETFPEIALAHLVADPNLEPEAAIALSELIRVAYSQFTKLQGKALK